MEDAIIGRIYTHDADIAHGHTGKRTSQSLGEPTYASPMKILLAAGITRQLVKPDLFELRAELRKHSADVYPFVDAAPDGDHEYAEATGGVDQTSPSSDHSAAPADDAVVYDNPPPHFYPASAACDAAIGAIADHGIAPSTVHSAANGPELPVSPLSPPDTPIVSEHVAVTPSPSAPAATSPTLTPNPESEPEPDATAPDNLAALDKFDEATLLSAVKRRFERDRIYTLVGDMLLCVNPLKPLPRLYTAATRQLYPPRLPAAADAAVPPHIFAVAQQAYANMTLLCRSQVVLVSGESGAGKTEASRLYFLAWA